MKRDIGLFIDDILESIQNIRDFTENINKEKFLKDKLRQSAISRELEIIGEAVKNIPEEIRKKYPFLPWKEIAGFRDVLSHSYFGVSIEKIWNVVENDLTELEKQIRKVQVEEGAE